MPDLFDPLTLGALEIPNRVVMAPLTRLRAQADGTPSELNVEYYAQRASVPGTLLITEATFISPRAAGFRHVPGIWSAEQVDGWRKVRACLPWPCYPC